MYGLGGGAEAISLLAIRCKRGNVLSDCVTNKVRARKLETCGSVTAKSMRKHVGGDHNR